MHRAPQVRALESGQKCRAFHTKQHAAVQLYVFKKASNETEAEQNADRMTETNGSGKLVVHLVENEGLGKILVHDL